MTNFNWRIHNSLNMLRKHCWTWETKTKDGANSNLFGKPIQKFVCLYGKSPNSEMIQPYFLKQILFLYTHHHLLASSIESSSTRQNCWFRLLAIFYSIVTIIIIVIFFTFPNKPSLYLGPHFHIFFSKYHFAFLFLFFLFFFVSLPSLFDHRLLFCFADCFGGPVLLFSVGSFVGFEVYSFGVTGFLIWGCCF